MASSTAPAPHAAPLPGPPPTPTSLLDLPAPWLLQLATSSAFDGKRQAWIFGSKRQASSALFRTCTLFRDTLLSNRTAVARLSLPLTPERFRAQLERLCTVARRSSRVRLEVDVEGQEEDGEPESGWMETEPPITHLLVCAAAQLGGEQPLACIKEIRLESLEQTALVPTWVKVLCPNATKLDWYTSTFPLDLPRPSMPHPHLQHLSCEWHYEGPPTAEHVRKQLSALPSLSFLTLPNMDWAEEEDEQQARRLISSTVTRLQLGLGGNVEERDILQRLPTQFPRLRELEGRGWLIVDDVGLEALLSMPHLERLCVDRFSLTRSHNHRAWRRPLQLTTSELDVQPFARLPLDSIQTCSSWRVNPSEDAAAVARVAEAVRRWGGLRSGWGISGSNVPALLTTLGPLLAALPAAQQRQLQIGDLQDATADQMQQLGQRLPASVTHLELSNCSLAQDAWPALLPTLPASVVELYLPHNATEQHVVAMCQAAVRPVKVVVSSHGTSLSLDRITSRLARGPGGGGEQQQRSSLVTLVRM